MSKSNSNNNEKPVPNVRTPIALWPIAAWGASTSGKDGETEKNPFKEVKLELRSNPSQASGPKFGAYFKVFESGSAEQWCRWRDDLERAWTGLGNNTGPAMANTVQHLLEGQARDDFDNFLTEAPEGTTPITVRQALQKVASGFFPKDSVSNLKQYLNYDAKKAFKMGVRDTATRLVRLNNWLHYFPSDGGTRVEPVLKLLASELPLVFWHLLPVKWRMEMEKSPAFDKHKATLLELIEFAERMEIVNGILFSRSENASDGSSSGPANGAGSKKNRNGSSRRSGPHNGKPEAGSAKGNAGSQSAKQPPRDCRVHGTNCGHSSHECKVLKAHAEKVRGAWEAQPKKTGPYKKTQYNNKTKPYGEGRTYSQNEVQVLLRKMEEKLTNEHMNMEANVDADMDEVLEELMQK